MKGGEFKRILVTNRGEIASRVIRAIRALDKLALVVYAEPDRELPFVKEADEAYSLGSGDLSDTYLNINAILRIAREAQADSIHPGYGFLSENEEFARACEKEGIHFIGPSAELISLMGNKSRARETASKLGIPVLEGETGDLPALHEKRRRLTYPLLLKPARGGGGKGMRIVTDAESFEQEATDASREALKYFGSGELYVERLLETPRHIEVQVIADHLGNRVHLFERECSLQRRYQKIIEEAPSVFISDQTRKRITAAALDLIGGIGYTNAGTVEFLVDQQQDFYFMEMNTRIQVEHPVTEALTGIDLVKEQITIAEGQALSFTQEEVHMTGHALEARIYAEDPLNTFLPSSGKLDTFELPGDGEIRRESGYSTGNMVGTWYDPLLAKLIVKGRDREEARLRMIRALEETHISGPSTNRDFLHGLLESDCFKQNRIHTGLLDLELQELLSSMKKQRDRQAPETLLAAAGYLSLLQGNEGAESLWEQIGHWRILPAITLLWDGGTHFLPYRRLNGNEGISFLIGDREMRVSLEQRKDSHYWLRINSGYLKVWGIRDRSEILMDVEGQQFKYRRPDIPDRRYVRMDEKQRIHAQGEISAPLNGRVARINVKKGDRVTEGENLVVIESMKMENKILSDHDAIVEQIGVSVGQQVHTNQILLTLASI